MLLDLVGGREAHEEAVVPGYRVRQTLDRFLELPVLALVLVERDLLRKPQDRQDAGQQWLLATFHDDVGPDRGRAPAVELRREIGDHAWHTGPRQRIDEIGKLSAPPLRKV